MLINFYLQKVLSVLSDTQSIKCKLMYYSFFFCFLDLHPQHMEVPRLGVELELQLLAYAITTATPDLSRVCILHQGSQQCQIQGSSCYGATG